MYEVDRESSLVSAEWHKTELEWIEGIEYTNTETEADRYGFQRGTYLQSDQWASKEWLKRGPKCTELVSKHASHSERPRSGGFRVALCNGKLSESLILGMMKDDFLTLEENFHLHQNTLPLFECRSGTFAKYTEHDHADGDEGTLRKIHFILKTPQKFEIVTWGLSCTYDLKTRVTTAFIMGEGILQFSNNKSLAGSRKFDSPFVNMIKTLENSQELWSHPLLVPTLLLNMHLSRTKRFCTETLTQKVMELEGQLGVTRVGRREKYGTVMTHMNWRNYGGKQRAHDLRAGAPLEKSDIISLTTQINTHYTKVLFTKSSPIWNREASDFLLHVKIPEQDLRQTRTITERLSSNITLAISIKHHVATLQSRLELQLSVLYSLVSQSDNHLSARLAAISGRDSTSMKILAFITTLFLPGTFVATLFSMSMFNWQYDHAGAVVSSRFWIYWVVAIPLTVGTMVGWATWWSFEKKRFDVFMNETLKDADTVGK